MKAFKAIAAMAANRVIGRGNTLPWHLPEDFAWFKRKTMGQVVVMGRRTFESLGRKPLPDRSTIVLSRTLRDIPGVRVASSLAEIDPASEAGEVFICGGAQIYTQALPLCSDLYLTVVKGAVEGNTFFPPFEHLFIPVATILDRPDFQIIHYHRRG
jgi:dihydrofolate reductase